VRKFYLILLCILTACAPITPDVNNKYQITAFDAQKKFDRQSAQTILISETGAVAGHQTEQMHYINKPYQLSSFVKNSWISPPAGMLASLMVQSMQHSNYFFAVASGPDSDKTDYRLDTQLIALQQNFLTNPTTLEFGIQVVLTHINDSRVVASHTFTQSMPCPSNNPYGGVVAANNTIKLFTASLTNYVISEVQQDIKTKLS
jgi:cholesterol transport system auxiliary component